jgi:adenylate cyclase
LSLKDEITQKVKDIMDTNFEVVDVSYVPDITDTKLTFGNKGLRFEATVLNIDMRGSTTILNKHNRSTVAKIHMAYFHTIVKIAGKLGGHVRSFNGDSMLVFFPGTTRGTLSNAVKAAMHMRYIISNNESGINKLLSKYSAIDYGIGIDDGKILVTKIGVGGDSNNKGLFWAGNAVNKAVKLSDNAKNPYHINISSWVYYNLPDLTKYKIHSTKEENMWTLDDFLYNNSQEDFYKTHYYWSFDNI